jgi:hypothetical protein
MHVFPAAAFLIATVSMAQADLSVSFIEGAPKDRFVVSSATDACAEMPLTVTINLDGSAGALVFDVTDQGAGVEVFQPFQLVAGADTVSTLPEVADGDTSVTLALVGLTAGKDVAFTIDVDDTINAREITVTDSEIEGATVEVLQGTEGAQAVFGENATAVLPGVCS